MWYERSCRMGESEALLKVIRNIAPIKMSGFNDRMYMQKLAYLVQEMGISGAHNFSWYARGPYSPTMTKQLFHHLESGTYAEVPPMNTAETTVHDKMHELLGDRINEPLTLELFASLWYLMPRAKISGSQQVDIIKIMYRDKPHFSRDEINRALSIIIAFRKKHFT